MEDNKNLIITRIFDAPRELVFQAWVDPKHLANWWGPKNFTNPVCELDARPQGLIRIDMQGSDGVIIPCKGRFDEIVSPERLVFITTAFEDQKGQPQLENRNTVTFEDYEGKTKLTLQVDVLKATPEVAGPLAGMEQGWSESFDKLVIELNNK